MRRLLPIFLIMLLSMNTLLTAKAKPVKLLNKNNSIFEQFRWQGIIQVQSSAFSIRMYYVLAKNKDAIRLDIMDSGIMGLTAEPLVRLYMKENIVLDAPSINQLQGLDPNWFIPPEAVHGLIHMTDSLQTKQAEIIAKHKFTAGNSVFIYDKKYRLSQIKSADFGFEALIIYNRHNQPDKISFKFRGKPIAELQIDKREYENIEIVPLDMLQNSKEQ